MPKNITLFLDGTWNDKDDPNARTNVSLLHDMCVKDDSHQTCYYDQGVGTDGWYDKKLGGLHGVGLSKNIRQAYGYLVDHYQPGDRVFIFGFSRGAFTARSLAGLLYRCGLLRADEKSQLADLFDAYKDRDELRMQTNKAANLVCPVTLLGVWDTVGALGIPVSFLKDKSAQLFGFHDTGLSPEVAFACHAVAIDEKRAAFEPTLWQESADTRARVQQVWFAGVHADVGGGYAERHHSDIALDWMKAHAISHGLQITPDHDYASQANTAADIHASTYRLFGHEIGVEEREAAVTPTNIPRVHWSVAEKLRKQPGYQPLALKKHLADPLSVTPYLIDNTGR